MALCKPRLHAFKFKPTPFEKKKEEEEEDPGVTPVVPNVAFSQKVLFVLFI